MESLNGEVLESLNQNVKPINASEKVKVNRFGRVLKEPKELTY